MTREDRLALLRRIRVVLIDAEILVVPDLLATRGVYGATYDDPSVGRVIVLAGDAPLRERRRTLLHEAVHVVYPGMGEHDVERLTLELF